MKNKEKETFQMRFAQKIKEARKRLGYTAQDLSTFTGISIPRISVMENGGTIIKTPQKFKSLCNILCDDGEIYAMWFIIVNELNFEEKNEKYVIDQLKNILSLHTPISE